MSWLVLSPVVLSPVSALGQSRLWRPEDRTLFTDFSYVTAVAATQSVVYAATPGALVVYDRGTGRLREAVGVMDGYPAGGATAMAADPNDDTAWLAAGGQWYMYRPWGREWESGALPGQALSVVLDAGSPAAGAWFSTTAGWTQIQRGGFPGMGGAPPPPGRRIAPLTSADLLRVAPAIQTVLLRVTRDDRLRSYPITMAAQAPVDNAVYIATAGNGVFKVDPVGYFTDKLPSGLLAPGAGGLALSRDGVCAGSDDRFAYTMQLAATHGRRGVTCVSDDGDVVPYEAPPGVAAAGPQIRGVATGPHDVIWAVSEAGVLRFAGSGPPARVSAANGLPSDDARAVAVDSGAGGAWVGTSIGLAFVTDADRPQVTASTRFGAAVGALATGRDTLWIGSALGLVMLPRGAAAPVPVTGGPVALRDPIFALAVRGDTVVAATGTRVLWRTGGTWSDVGTGVPNVGALVGVAIDERGVWAAGTSGIAFFTPRAGTWMSYTAPGDLPTDVQSIVAGRRYVWVGTRYGLVRFDRRALER